MLLRATGPKYLLWLGSHMYMLCSLLSRCSVLTRGRSEATVVLPSLLGQEKGGEEQSDLPA